MDKPEPKYLEKDQYTLQKILKGTIFDKNIMENYKVNGKFHLK
jgi:hypothetical protein